MKKKFYDGHQAAMYLQDSVVRRGERGIYIIQVDMRDNGDKFKFYYKYLDEEGTNISFWPDRAVNLYPVSLGMMNAVDGRSTVMSYRIPRRAWKIGLSKHNFFAQNIDPDGPGSRRNWFAGESMAKTIIGDYPTFRRAWEISARGDVCAFSRRFAVKEDKLYYKHLGHVGAMRGSIHLPSLLPQFEFLQEVLEEDVRL